jgi:hypothetical protein
MIAALLLGVGLPAAASDTSARPNPADQRVLITAVKLHGKEIVLTFKATGEVRTYYVDELSMLADGKGPLEVSEIRADREVYAFVLRDGRTIDSLIIGHPPAQK